MATETGHVAYRFGPLQRPTFIGGLSRVQVGTIGVTGALAMGILRAFPTVVGLLATLVLAAIGTGVAFVRVGSRPVEEWVAPLAHWTASGRAGRRFVSAAPAEGDRSKKEGRMDPPPAFRHIKLLTVRLATGEVGVIKDAQNGTYAGMVACRGGAFPLVDRTEQDRLLALWGEVLDGWALDHSPIFRLQLLERTVPEDGDAMGAYLREAMAADPSSTVVRSYLNLVEGAQPLSQRHETYVVIAVSARRAAAAIRQAGGGDRGACELLAQELASLQDRLHMAEIRCDGVLGPRAVARFLRTSFDPSAVEDLAHRAAGEQGLAGASPRNAWPTAAEAAWPHYRTDGAFHATFWVSEWPRLNVGADFMAPLLLQSRGIRTVSVVMEPVPPAKATREVEAARTNFLADEKLRAQAGYLSSARRQREQEAIEEREQELAAGHGSYRFSAYITVTAESPEALEKRATEVVRLANRCRLDLRRLYAQQDEAFACTLPLARGLR